MVIFTTVIHLTPKKRSLRFGATFYFISTIYIIVFFPVRLCRGYRCRDFPVVLMDVVPAFAVPNVVGVLRGVSRGVAGALPSSSPVAVAVNVPFSFHVAAAPFSANSAAYRADECHCRAQEVLPLAQASCPDCGPPADEPHAPDSPWRGVLC